MILKYIFPFLASFFLTVTIIFFAIKMAKKIKWSGRREIRHIHRDKICRFGGVAMIISFNAAVLLNSDLKISSELYGFMIGSLILLIIGIWDDLKEIFWKIQLFIQIAIAVFVFIMGIKIYYISNPFSGGIIKMDSGWPVILSAGIVIFWIVLIMNVVNWSDGIDGLASGISLITIFAILILSLRPEVNQPAIAIICSILAGTILGFLIFNFNPSQILAGTSGAMFMGFSLAIMAIFSGTKIATALLVLVIPLIDFFWVIGERIREKKSIFKPNRNHLHYKLMELGWSQMKIVVSYWLITAIIAAVALNTRALGKGLTLFFTGLIMLLILILVNKKISLLQKSQK